MRFGKVPEREEVEQIRQACADLGADAELTALILGSHRRDRTLPAPAADDCEDVHGYVRRKLALWNDILYGPSH